jgi:thiol:disulfide interchange protein
MRQLVPYLVLVVVLGLAACGGSEDVPSADSGAKSGSESTVPAVDMEKVLAEAGESGRNVLVEYYSKSCSFCRQMDRETYSDGDVKKALEGVVYVRLHQKKNADWFEARWGKQGTPTFVVLKPDGTQIGKSLTGIIDVANFLTFLDWAKSGEGDQPEIKTGGS